MRLLLIGTLLSTATAASALAQAQGQEPATRPQSPGMTTPPADSPAKSPAAPGQTQPPAAQTTSPAAKSTIAAELPARQMPGQQLASNLMGMTVYGAKEEKIGSVNDMLVDESGKVAALLVGVGGFLGIGEKNVAIPYEAVTRTGSSGRPLVTKFSKADLENAPAFVSISSDQGSGTSAGGGSSGASGTTPGTSSGTSRGTGGSETPNN